MKLAAAYIRVSTDNQTELSPESQIKEIRSYAKKNGYIVPDEYIFRDDGISGKHTKKRTEFNKMIGVAKTKPKPFEAILLWKFSRFARNREDSIVYKSMLRKQCGIDVISISENIGDDKMSILIEALIEAMDEYYSVNLSEEVKRGMYEKFQRGGVLGPAPFGYKNNKDTKDFEIDENNAEIIRDVFKDFLQGKPMRAIAQELNFKGIKTVRGNLWDNRGIEYLLQNPVYIGKHRWSATKHTKRDYYGENVEIIDGTHAPIIDDEIFKKVQKIMLERKRVHIKNSHTAHKKEYFLRGLLRCSTCGATLTQAVGGKSYQCHRYAKGQCSVSHSVLVDNITSAIIDQLRKDAEIGDITINCKQSDQNNNELNERIEKLILAEQKKLVRIKEAYEAGIDTLDEYRENKKNIQTKIDQYKLQKFKQPKINSKAKKEFTKQIKNTVSIITSPDIPIDQKNTALKSIIEKIIYDRQNSSIQIFYYL